MLSTKRPVVRVHSPRPYFYLTASPNGNWHLGATSLFQPTPLAVYNARPPVRGSGTKLSNLFPVADKSARRFVEVLGRLSQHPSGPQEGFGAVDAAQGQPDSSLVHGETTVLPYYQIKSPSVFVDTLSRHLNQ